MTEENIKRATLAEIRAMRERGELFYGSHAPEGPELGDEFWENATFFDTDQKTSVHLKLDSEVFLFFKSQGKGHITRMQNVLKAYVRAQKAKTSPASEDKPRKTG